MSAARLEALNRQLDYVRARSEFYRERLREAGAPARLGSIEEFCELPPVMDKEVERRSLEEGERLDGHPFGRHLCARPEALHAVLTTSGTTGAPTWYLFTRGDWARALTVDRRALRLGGVAPGDVAVYAFASGGYIATLHVHALRSMGVVTYEAGAHLGPERLGEMLTRLRPQVLLGTPTTLGQVLDTGWRPARPVRRIICGGEPAAAIPGVRARLEEGFGGEVRDIFGPVSGHMFMSCGAPRYAGLHFLSPDLGLGLDDIHVPGTLAPLARERLVEGELYFTALRHEAAPLVKFATGDVVSVERDRCECGARTPRIFFHGRAADTVPAGAVKVGPWHVREAASALAGLSANLRLVRPSSPSAGLTVLVEHRAGAHAVERDARSLAAALAGRFAVPVEVHAVPPGALPSGAPKTALTIDEAGAAAVLALPGVQTGRA